MNCETKFLGSLLLVVAIATSNFGQTTFRTTQLNTIICNESQTKEFISIMNITNITINEIPRDKNLVVLTDSTDIYSTYKERLIEEEATFIPFYGTIDMQTIFRIAVIFHSTKEKIKFIIHGNSSENAANIFENLANFIDISDLKDNIAVALTIPDVEGNIMTNDEYINRVAYFHAVFNSLTSSNNWINPPFRAIMNNSPKYFRTFSTWEINKRNKITKFTFSQKIQKQCNCAMQYVNQQVSLDMKKVVEELENKSYEQDTVATMYNCLWSFARSNHNNVNNYILNFRKCFNGIQFPKTHALVQNEYLIKLILFTECFQFQEASVAWSEPLRNFQLQRLLGNLKNWYPRTDNGLLIRRKVNQSCNAMRKDFKLNARGNFVKLSDLDFKQCDKEPKVIEIFGLEKVIIDKDMDFTGKDVQMIIIAPIWEVISSSNNGTIERRLINLNGRNGTNFNKERADNGTRDGNRNGANGLAGKPGGPAGSLYGLTNKIINAEQLTILANGGRGGNGQSGGHGAVGADGLSYNGAPAIVCDEKLEGWQYKLSVYVFNTTPRLAKSYVYDKIYGKPGKVGGSGGNGGIGGMGGKYGLVNIFQSSNNRDSFELFAQPGNKGLDGEGGKAALGGKNGKIMTTNILCHLWGSLNDLTVVSTDTGSASMGLEGKSGISLKRKIDAEDSHSENSLRSSLIRYKIFIRTHLAYSNFTNKQELWEFHDDLNINMNSDNTLSLVEDYIGLEKQFFSLNDKINFIKLYQQLKNRIDMFAENPYEEESNAEYKKIIKELKNDAEKRLKSVRSYRSYYDVILNVNEEAANSLKPLIIQLKNFRTNNYILRLLKQHIFSLEDTMADGERLIKTVATDAIWDTEDMLDQELNSLLTEILEMEKEALTNQDELKKSREKLEQIMMLKILFGILKVAGGALGIINPVLGTAAASAIGVVEAFTTDGSEAQVAALPKALENVAKESESYFKDMEKEQEKIIEEQRKFVNKKIKETRYGAAVITDVWDSSSKYRSIGDGTQNQKLKNSGYVMMEVYASKETELTIKLDKLQKSGQEKNINKIKAVESGLAVAKYLKATSVAFTAISESAISIMKDEKKVNEIDAALKKSHVIWQRLNLLENNIYDKINPLLTNMKTNLDSVKSDLENMNEFQQEIAKWNVTGTIKGIQRILNNVTKNFKVNEKMNFAFDKLIADFDSLFNLHTLLLDSKKEKSDKFYLTNLLIAHSNHGNNLLISDSELRNAISELQILRITNQLAEKYDKWLFALKQYAFPYSGEILDSLPDLSEFRNESMTNFGDFIIKNKDFIIANSAFAKTTDNKMTTVFRGSNFPYDISRFSFYIWKNDENKQELKDILNGVKTTLVADINNFNLTYDSVKFNRIKILFTANNGNMQEELNEELKNFDVKLTHHGDSKYRYGNSIYDIRNNPTLFWFAYAANNNERESQLVSRFANAPYMLSPYATWSIELSPIHPSRNFTFLQKFADIVSLELIGNAEYLKNSTCDSTCEVKMKKFYTLATDLAKN
ncbi:uncharacterized protein LOC127289014 [Leptopilina boulardi]|uniref:uncharacterized protein LOC127289014 n=1 Tax=Leptopilina boulardi TaxID=63433 RepID=UPI0021F586F6|nr:uncharacterized protein LOC127289014 [Leptopilina boulardi]